MPNPADRWYEWQTQESGPKQPYFAHRPDDALFWFAGLAATDAAGNRTVAIVTTDANEAARPVLPRMPLMLPDNDAGAAWIDPEADQVALESLLEPPAAEAIEAYPFAGG